LCGIKTVNFVSRALSSLLGITNFQLSSKNDKVVLVTNARVIKSISGGGARVFIVFSGGTFIAC
jgi:hypothetical protein